MTNPQVQLKPMCDKHRKLLVTQANYKQTDNWIALEICTAIALFQAATADAKTYDRIDRKIENIGQLGCLACYKPDVFGEIVEAAKTKELGKIKAIGEAHIEKYNIKMEITKDE